MTNRNNYVISLLCRRLYWLCENPYGQQELDHETKTIPNS